MTVNNIDAFEGIALHALEFAELTGIINPRQADRQLHCMGGEQAGADMGAKPVAHAAGLANAGRRDRIAQATQHQRDKEEPPDPTNESKYPSPFISGEDMQKVHY